MDWWTGMNSCGPGSQMGDMNQIEIFDPWINCDDLDLGTILHQASSNNNNNNNTTTCTTNTSSSSITASPSSLSLTSAASGAAGLGNSGSSIHQNNNNNNNSNNNSTDRQMTSHLAQNGSFVVGGQSSGISLMSQQQHQHRHSHQQLSPDNNKQNIFNIISNVTAANAISSHNQISQHHLHSSQQHNQLHNHQQQQQLVSGNRNHAPQTSISSSQCSSISSTGSGSLSSVESSPVNTNNNHHNNHNQQKQQQLHLQLNNSKQHQAASINMNGSLYLSNSSLNSSPILVPITAANSPLMADSNHSNNLLLHHQNNNNRQQSLQHSLLEQHSGYSRQQLGSGSNDQLHQHHHQLQQQQQANLYHHQIMVASGNGAPASAPSSSTSPTSSSSSLSATSSEQVRPATDDQGHDESKRNLQHLLHLASKSDINAHNVSLVTASDCRSNYNTEVINSHGETTGDSPFSATLTIDPQNHNQLSIVRSALASVKSLTTNTANLVAQSNNNSDTMNSSLQTATSDKQHQQQQVNSRSTINGAKTGRSDATSYLTASCSSLSLNNGINTKTNNAGQQQAPVQKVRRCRHITDYVLADEEKRLLIKEGYGDFPMTCQSRPLSKAEEKILRKIRRKIRNKKSAQCSRQRKKEYVEDLERKYKAVIRENEELKQVLNRIQQKHQSELRIY